MLLDRLAHTWSELGATPSRLAKRQLIADVLRETPDADVETVVAYLSGGLRQRRTGVGGRSLHDLPPPAAEPSLTVAEVDAAFERIAALSGPGSVAARSAAVADLFGRATAAEQHFLRGLVFGELRQGASEAAVQEGLAAAALASVVLVLRLRRPEAVAEPVVPSTAVLD